MKKTVLFTIVILLFSIAAFAKVRNAEEPPKQANVVPAFPTTIEEKLDASQLAIYGQIVSIVEQLPEKTDPHQRSALNKFIASVRVLDTFKGAVAGDTVSLEYIESEYRSNPPMLTFVPSEKCILFLRYSDGGLFTTLSPTIGKESASEQLLSQLRAKSGKTAGKGKSAVVALLKAGEASGGGNVYVTLTLINNTGGDFLAYSGISLSADIVVKGPDGKILAPNQNPLPASGASGKAFLLAPGHFIGARIDLSSRFDFEKPGVYSVSARLPTPASGSASAAYLVSNTVSVTVGKITP